MNYKKVILISAIIILAIGVSAYCQNMDGINVNSKIFVFNKLDNMLHREYCKYAIVKSKQISYSEAYSRGLKFCSKCISDELINNLNAELQNSFKVNESLSHNQMPSKCPQAYFPTPLPIGADFPLLENFIDKYGKAKIFESLSGSHRTIRIGDVFRTNYGSVRTEFIDSCTIMYDLIRSNIQVSSIDKLVETNNRERENRKKIQEKENKSEIKIRLIPPKVPVSITKSTPYQTAKIMQGEEK